MGILANLRRLFTAPVSCGPLPPAIPRTDVEGLDACEQPVVPNAQIPQVGVSATAFVPSFKPFKAEKKLEGPERIREDGSIDNCNYPYGYGFDFDTYRFKEVFRSKAEVEWARTLDQLGLSWEYEPLKFAMGPEHLSYTPDFSVTGLSIPGSDRALYIEVKRFPDYVDLTKYVRFTEWYNCDLLVLAHEKGGLLKPRKEKYFLVLRCTHCNTYDCFPCNGMPTDDYKPPGYEYSHAGSRPSACQEKPLERIVVPNYFLIQAGAIGRGRVVLLEPPSGGLQISYVRP